MHSYLRHAKFSKYVLNDQKGIYLSLHFQYLPYNIIQSHRYNQWRNFLNRLSIY